MALNEGIGKLESLGWTQFPDRLSSSDVSFYKQFDSDHRCEWNDDRPGVQVAIKAWAWPGGEVSYSVDMRAGAGGRAYRLESYGLSTVDDQERAEFENAAKANGIPAADADCYVDFKAGWLAARREAVPVKDVREFVEAVQKSCAEASEYVDLIPGGLDRPAYKGLVSGLKIKAARLREKMGEKSP